MLNHGIQVLIVSKRLGHSKPSITIDIYGHLIPSRQGEAAKLMDNLMFDGDVNCTRLVKEQQKKTQAIANLRVFAGKYLA